MLHANRTLLLFMAIAIGVIVLLVPFILSQREAARMLNCGAHLYQIRYALNCYHQEHGRYPPICIRDENGTPMHSWRILLLPCFGAGDVYKRYNFSKPWNDPQNMDVGKSTFRDVFQCPTDTGAKPEWTSYVAVIVPENEEQNDKRHADGMGFAIVEMKNSGIHWLEPRDISLDEALPNLMEMSPHPKDANLISSRGEIGRWHGPTK